MLKHTKTIAILALLGAGIFACKKNDPAPSVAPLSTVEAKTQLSATSTVYKSDSIAFVGATTTVSSTLNSLSNNSALPSNFAVSVGSLRMDGENSPKVMAEIATQLAAIALEPAKGSLLGARIPNTYEAA